MTGTAWGMTRAQDVDLDQPQAQVLKQLAGMAQDELRALREREEAHGGRKGVLTEIDKGLGKDISEIRQDLG